MLGLRNWAAVGLVLAGLSPVGVRAQDAGTAGVMTLDDLRVYMETMHIKDADERGVRVQMQAQKSQLPPWFPQNVLDEMTTRMLTADLPALEYPFVKSCVNAQEMHALTALFATPDGQRYVLAATGGMVAKEATGTDPLAAHQQMLKEDHGLPMQAIEGLPREQRALVKKVMASGAMNCFGAGFQKASGAVTDARTSAARQVIAERRSELQAAQQKFESEHPAAAAK